MKQDTRFSSNLRKLRTLKNMSITNLATKVGTTTDYIHKLESCKRVGVSVYRAEKIAEVLGVTLQEMMQS